MGTALQLADVSQQPPVEQAPATPYTPSLDTIHANENFEFALSAAPNVLYQRYMQYGQVGDVTFYIQIIILTHTLIQLGVLGWCSEFGELIDGLKTLGLSGNMFITTRTQALKSCEDILALKMEELKMQIIIMFLSSQVARLRRFLDADRVWNDYPDTSFPLEQK